MACGSVLVKAIHSNSSACVDSLLENSKRSRKTRLELSNSWFFFDHLMFSDFKSVECILPPLGIGLKIVDFSLK